MSDREGRVPSLAAARPDLSAAAEWFMASTAVIYLVAYSTYVLGGGVWRSVASIVMTALWVAFLLEYAWRLARARQRVRWFFRHFPEFVLVALPMLRPLRLLQLLLVLHRLHHTLGRSLQGRVSTYAAGSAAILLYVAALSMLEVERTAPNSQITSFSDALWWAFVTVTTVGYGDLTPVTTPGRVIAAVLMLGGISLLGVITGLIASYIVRRVGEESQEQEVVTREQVAALHDEVRELRKEINLPKV